MRSDCTTIWNAENAEAAEKIPDLLCGFGELGVQRSDGTRITTETL